MGVENCKQLAGKKVAQYSNQLLRDGCLDRIQLIRGMANMEVDSASDNCLKEQIIILRSRNTSEYSCGPG